MLHIVISLSAAIPTFIEISIHISECSIRIHTESVHIPCIGVRPYTKSVCDRPIEVLPFFYRYYSPHRHMPPLTYVRIRLDDIFICISTNNAMG